MATINNYSDEMSGIVDSYNEHYPESKPDTIIKIKKDCKRLDRVIRKYGYILNVKKTPDFYYFQLPYYSITPNDNKVECLDAIRINKDECVEINEIDFEETLPHKVSEVICLRCLKRWFAVRPESTLLKKLECPCGSIGLVIETGEVVNK